MGNRFYIAIALIAIVIIGGIFVNIKINNVCSQCIEAVSLVEQSIARGDSVAALSTLLSAQNFWAQSLPFTASVITHDYLDNVSEAFAKACAFLQEYNTEELRGELTELCFHLERVRCYDRLTVRSIF